MSFYAFFLRCGIVALSMASAGMSLSANAASANAIQKAAVDRGFSKQEGLFETLFKLFVQTAICFIEK
jgi:hypothetical protein